MAGPSAPEPVKYFVAVLYADAALLPEVRTRLTERFGAIDFEGPERAFDLTDYYACARRHYTCTDGRYDTPQLATFASDCGVKPTCP